MDKDFKLFIFIFIFFKATAFAYMSSSNKGTIRHSKSDHKHPPEVAKFLSHNQTFSAEEGQEVTFPCVVDRKDEEYKMIFKFVPSDGDDRIIYAEDIKVTHYPRIQKVGSSFLLQKVHKSDAGMYICRFETNPVMQLIHRLDVHYPAEIDRVGSKLRKVIRGSTLTLQCISKGNPRPTITWSKDEGPLNAGTFSVEGPSITLKNVDLSDEGTYICKASNGVGSSASSYISIVVEYPPEITEKQSIVFGKNGVDAQIICIVHGKPKPGVTWYRGESPVSSEKHVMTDDGSHRHTLTITHVNENDFGEYNCTARNKYGQQSKSLVVAGLPKKPRIISSPAGDEKTMYTLIFETESLGPILQYHLRYRKAPLDLGQRNSIPWIDFLYFPSEETRGRNKRPHNGVFTIKHIIDGLEPSEDYEAMVRVESRFGWSSYSDAFHFYTRKKIFLGHSTSEASNFPLDFSNLFISFLIVTVQDVFREI